MHKTCTLIILYLLLYYLLKTILRFIFKREGNEIMFVLGMGVSTAGPSQDQN